MSEEPEEPRRHRVAVVAACTFPAPRGSQVYLRTTVEQLAAAGNDVHLVTYGSLDTYESPPGVQWHRSRWRFGSAAGPGLRWSKLVENIALFATLARVVRRASVEVIHAHNYEAPLFAYWLRWRTGVSVVYHAHNALGDELVAYAQGRWRSRMAHTVGSFLDRQIPKRADFVVALTAESEAFLVAHGVSPERVAVVPPSPSRPEFEPLRHARTATEPRRYTILYAGNLDPYQGINVLVAAFARLRRMLPEAHLAIATHEREWPQRLDARVSQWVREGTASVWIENDYVGVQCRMANADVLVCPRSSWSGYPIKLLNYCAAGRAIVVARGSAKGLQHDKTALIVENDDDAGLAAAVLRLHGEPRLAEELGRAAMHYGQSQQSSAEIAFKFRWIHGKIGVGRDVASSDVAGCGRRR